MCRSLSIIILNSNLLRFDIQLYEMLFFTINIILKKKKQIESKTNIDKKNYIWHIPTNKNTTKVCHQLFFIFDKLSSMSLLTFFKNTFELLNKLSF